VTLEKDLELYASSILDKYHMRKVDRKKIIRDAVMGTHELSALEVSILDIPFVQRLRGISQTALACLTYPSATHNRFGHSLGVSIMAYRMGRALGDEVDESTLLELKIAGLLHDIGHGPFSHASEEIIGELDDIKQALEKDARYSIEKPHEMIAYMILQTGSFKDFFEEVLKVYERTDVSLDNISEMIIGSMHDREKNQYKADIINGAFDADKLDYLTRDSYFTGIRMAIDIERILATQMIDPRKDKPRGIIVDIGGVHILEQIIFSKMLLYPSVYHHHKVRSALCMLKSVFEIIRDDNFLAGGLKFDKVSDFLRVNDCFLLTENGKPQEVAEQVRKINQRDLLKRALVISRKTLKKEEGFEDLLARRDRPQDLRDIAREMAQDKRLKNKCQFYDVWLDIPEDPRFPEPSQCWVKITDKSYERLDEFFPVTEWSSSFSVNKWKGFVFCPPEVQKTTDNIARNILGNLFNLELNDQATVLAKHASYAT